MKKALSLILAVLMLAAFVTGCNAQNEASESTPPQSSAPASAAPAESAAPTSNYNYEPLFNPDVPDDQLSDLKVTFEELPTAKSITLPLSEETANISALITFQSNYFVNLSDTPVDQELERRTNVHVDYSSSSNDAANEAFNLMIASGDYPDIIFGAQSYVGGGDKAIDDGVYLRLNDLIAENAPNYTAMRHLSADHTRGTVTDGGNLYGFFCLLVTPEPPWCGLVMRQDWLDELGLKVPVTLADWENVMSAFMDKKGAKYGVCINPGYIAANNNDEFVTSFDVNARFFQIDGKVHYGPIEEGYGDYLALANSWYNKGYIDKNFTQYSNYGEYLKGDAYYQFANGNVGAAQTLNLAAGHQLYTNKISDNPNLLVTSVKNPVRNVGDAMHLRQVTSPVKTTGGGAVAAISTQAVDPVLCCKWLDYRYTQDGCMLISYGVPGNNYEYNESTNEITYTKSFVNFEDGMQQGYNKFIGYEMLNCNASIYSRVRGSIFTGSDYDDNAAIFASDGCDYVIPVDVAFVNADESAEYSALFADIQTYVDEMTTKFITGVEPLANFPKFVEKVKAMNIDRCIELKQNGLTAYYNRPID